MLTHDTEVWARIAGYSNYHVSNEGRVKSTQGPTMREHILSTAVHNSGYHYVDLWRDGKVKHTRVNRLVAGAFCDNDDPATKTYVNHMDENKLNNKASNLEWVTPKYNTNYGTAIERRVATRYSR